MTGVSTRRRTRRTISVYTGAEDRVATSRFEAPSRGARQATSAEYEQIRKGMSYSDVQRLLGNGDAPENAGDRRYMVVNYRQGESSITVVFKDHRVISKAQLGC
jgi:hypothetical protein